MTPELKAEIQQIIREEFQKNYLSGAPKVAPHTHNGIDNLPVDAVTSLTAGSNVTITPSGATKGDITISAASGSLEVKDTIVDVTGVTIMEFPAGSVTDNGGGDVSIAVSATPAGADTEIQYNSSGAFGADSNFTFTTFFSFVVARYILHIGGTQIYHQSGPASNQLALYIKAPDQTATNENGADIFIRTGAGDGVGLSGDVYVENPTTNDANLIINQSNTTDGKGVVLLGEVTTVPTTVAGGGILYSSGGALHWLGSSGTDTTIAPA